MGFSQETLNQVVLIPDFGWYSTEFSSYTRGAACGAMVDVDIIDTYVACLAEELEDNSIPYHYINTRRRPGLTNIERIESVMPNSLVILCSSYAYEERKKLSHNRGKVHHGKSTGEDMATEFKETMDEWGRRAFFHYQVTKHSDESPMLNIPNCKCIKLEPFYINGLGSGDLAANLYDLGRDIGRLCTEYVRRR